MKLFAANCPATLDDVAGQRRALRRRLTELRLPQDAIDTLQLVLAEIGANAVRHARPAPTELDLLIELEGASLRVEIADDGKPFAGFPERWRRAGGMNLGALDGSGRGLALLHPLMEGVEYRPGPPNRFSGRVDLQRTRPTVLIVEDSAPLLDAYEAVLRMEHKVLTALTLDEAIGIARTERADVIVADYHLSDGQGTQLVDALDDDERRPPTPIIILSGDADPAIRTAALMRGVDQFLTKPVRAADLRRAVRETRLRAARRNARLFRYFSATVERAGGSPAHIAAPGFAVETVAGAAALGSGDFVMDLPRDDGRRRVILADVMGHGLSAQAAGVAFAAMLRTVHTLREAGGPADYLGAVSQAMFADPLVPEHFMTLAVMDLGAEGAVTLALGGHPAPLLSRDGAVTPLAIDGPLPGVFPGQRYEELPLRLAPGERLVLTTDGLDPRGEDNGICAPGWFRDVTGQAADLFLPDALEMLRQSVVQRVGVDPADDWTVMLVERAEAEPSKPASR